MPKLFVFGIGGTGQRVLHSLTMLLAAGVDLGQFTQVVPIEIDPDATNGNLTQANNLLREYMQICDGMQNKANAGFFATAIVQAANNFMVATDGTSSNTFRQFINYPALGQQEQALVDMLFSQQNLNDAMNEGFHGNPNIGSVVFDQIVSSQSMAAVINQFQQGDRIFIISSIFGGTGASGFPTLARKLRTWSGANNNLLGQAMIGAVSVLPYFTVEADGNSPIDSSTFISKTKSALDYYRRNLAGLIDELYFIGDCVSAMYENQPGGFGQKNSSHLVELLAATSIVQFCNTPARVHQTNGPINYYELGVRDDINNDGGALKINHFQPQIRSMLSRPLTQFVMLAGALADDWDFISGPNLAANYIAEFDETFYRSLFMSQLKQFCSDFKAWLGEMQHNNRSADLYNLNAGQNPFDIVIGVPPYKVMSNKSDYPLVEDRINSAVRKCEIKDTKEGRFVEMMYKATSRLVSEKFKF